MLAAATAARWPAQRRRQLGVEMVEHRLGPLPRGRQVALDRSVDLAVELVDQALLVGLGPDAGLAQEGAQARDRVVRPLPADLLAVAVAGGIVGGGVVGHPIGQRLDHARALAAARPLERALDQVADRDHVVAVDLLARDAGRDRLLRQRRGRGLGGARHRDRPLVVVDHEHRRHAPDAGDVDRLVEGAVRGRAVAAHADRDPRLALQLEGIGGAGRMQALARDRHRDREVGARARRSRCRARRRPSRAAAPTG